MPAKLGLFLNFPKAFYQIADKILTVSVVDVFNKTDNRQATASKPVNKQVQQAASPSLSEEIKMTIDRTAPVNSVKGIQPRVMSDRVTSPGGKNTQPRVDKPVTAQSASVTLSDAKAVLLKPQPDDVNTERVEMLKTAIRNGELVMDTGKIADTLIRQAQELIQSE